MSMELSVRRARLSAGGCLAPRRGARMEESRELGEATTGWVYVEEPVWPGKPVRSLQPAVETSRAGDPFGKASGDELRW